MTAIAVGTIPGTWVRRAACADPAIGSPAERDRIFFPERGRGDLSEARAVCARCPVREECRDFAIATKQRSGVWGGLSTQERIRRWSRRCRQCGELFDPDHPDNAYCPRECAEDAPRVRVP